MSEKSITMKLLIKEGHRILVLNAPEGYEKKIGKLPKDVELSRKPDGIYDIIQVFVTSKAETEAQLPRLRRILKPKGILWVTYPKGTSKAFKVDVNRDSIREYASTVGMEGVAIFSVDDDWSALRLKLI